MALLASRKRYRLGGDFSMRDRDGEGLEHHFVAGDVFPDELAASLSKREIETLMGTGMLRVIGAPPAAKAAPEPARPLTITEILHHWGWSNAAIVDGQVADGPRGFAITVLDKTARESDLREVAGLVGRDAGVVVHLVDGEPMATISFARLAPLFQATLGR